MGRIFFSFLFVGLFIYISSPLLLPVAFGALQAVLLFPWLEKLEAKKVSSAFASALLTVGIGLGFLLPIGILIFFGAKAGLQYLKSIKESPSLDLLQLPGIHRIIEFLSNWFPGGTQELINMGEDISRSIGVRIADTLGNIFSHLPGMFMAAAVVILSTYFFLIDGRRLLLFIRRNSVFSPQQTDQLIDSLASMCRSVILATIVSGLAQSLLEILACILTGTPNAAFIGLLVFLGSFLPLVGATPMTFGVALQQFLAGHSTVGILLLITAFIIVTVDNVIRPAVLKDRANLHPLLAFISAFGGLQILGFAGIFLGPIIAGLFVVTIQILIQGRADGKA